MYEATPRDTIRKHDECTLSAAEVINREQKTSPKAVDDTCPEQGRCGYPADTTRCSGRRQTHYTGGDEDTNHRHTKLRLGDTGEHTGFVGERLGGYDLLLQHMLEINHLLDVVPQESWSAAEAGVLAAALRGIAAGRASAKSRFNFGERRFRIVQ
jgi:hypothetical protein